MKVVERMVETTEGLGGFRIFDGHDPRVEAAVLADPSAAKIILKRRPIDSFVSLEIAKKTDQWILGNVNSRKTAKITFNPQSYERYCATLDAYYARIARALQETGQGAFTIGFDDLKDSAVMNGLARFLGSDEQRTKFAETIKRQNPEPLSEKVENYAQMMTAIARDAPVEPAPQSPIAQLFHVKDLIVSKTHPVVVAPIPGTARKPIVDWLKLLSGGSAQIDRGFSRGDLQDWLDKTPGLVSVSLVEHPLSRAYRVFQRRIIGDAKAFPAVREKLVQHYGMTLPEAGDDAAKTAAAFEVFLTFLKANLGGQTSIRLDPDWCLQSDHLSAITDIVPLSNIIRAPDFPAETERLGAQFGVATAGAALASHGGGVPLSEIYSKRHENLARAAYARDYRVLGFGDWGRTYQVGSN